MQILNTTSVMVARNNNVAIVFGVVCIICMALLFFSGMFESLALTIVPGTLCVASLYGAIWFSLEVESKIKQYEVLLDDTYPATQLIDNYIVIGQHGDILVIQDKE